MKKTAPAFIDITIKEGGFRIHHTWLLDQVEAISHELESAGIEFVEVCHGMGIGGKEAGCPGLHTDMELLQAAKKRTGKIKYCVYLDPYRYSYAKIETLAPHFDIGRIGVNVHEPDEAKKSITKLKGLGKQVIGQILRAHSRSPKEAAKTAQKLSDWGSDVVYLTDTFGSFDTEDVKKYLGAMSKHVSVPLGFQGKNNTGLAVANSLTAWQKGAQWLDGALLGMGPGAGMAPLEQLIATFQSMGYCEPIRLSDLCNAGKFFVKSALRSTPSIQYLDLMMAKEKLDYYPQEFLTGLSYILDMDLAELIKGLKNSRKKMVELQQDDLRAYLKSHRMDLDVVVEFLRTGKISVSNNFS